MSCSTGNVCTTNDHCNGAGSCVAGTPVTGPGCSFVRGTVVDQAGNPFTAATISVDGQPFAGASYLATVAAGTHSVNPARLAPYDVYYSACVNCTDHAASSFNLVTGLGPLVVNVPSGGYVDVQWSYRAPVFAPTQCSQCPATTEVDWAYRIDGTSGSQQPTDWDLSCSPDPTVPCAHYINNITSAVQQIVANQYVSQFGFRVDSFNTEFNRDRLQYGLTGPFPPAGILSGVVTPGTWFDFTSPGSFQSQPGMVQFDADGQNNDLGFSIGRARVCCGATPQAAPAPMLRRATPIHGVLLGTNDVVFVSAPSMGSAYHRTLTLHGNPNSGNRFDLSVLCNGIPSPFLYDFLAYRPGVFQMLHLPLNYCVGGTLNIAVHSRSGSGSFELVIHDHLPSQHYRMSVATDFPATPTQVATIVSTLGKGMLFFFGATEGTQFIEGFDFWNNPLNGCSNCAGGACDICVRAPEGQSVTDMTTHRITLYSGGLPTSPNYPFVPGVVAHELGHSRLQLPDEYGPTDSNNVHCPVNPLTNNGKQCYLDGHTIMANPYGTVHNLCQINDHFKDATPFLASGASFPSNWDTYASTGTAAYESIGTEDQYNYGDSDFDSAGILGAVAQH